MGNLDCSKHDAQKNINENNNKIKVSDFTKINRIGRGSLGPIWKVIIKSESDLKQPNNISQKNNSNFLAMKEFSKAKAYLKKNQEGILRYRKIMEICDYNLLCKVYYAFQDTDTLYIIMDYFPGSDLRYLLNKRDFFTEQETKFTSACILLSINYLHEKNVIYRNLKPEKLLFDSKGYLHLIGSSVSFECKKGETITNLSGTGAYMAPEAIINKPHDFSVDYYALGVILYELTFGERPYKGTNRKEIKEQMFSREINLIDDDIPEGWDTNVADLINRLMQRKKKKRLGNNGIDEIKSHPWFKDVQWEKTENFTFNSPFVIDSEDNFDKSFVEKQDDDSIYEGKKQIYINAINESLIYKNFFYNYEDKSIENNKNNNN